MAHPLAEESASYAAEWAKEHLPSYGPDWDLAIEYGIDVTLLLENLALTPAQRLARLQQVVEFHELLREARPSR